jgi:hypothetical protein
MRNDKLITLLGIIFILLWLSNIPYLFPLPFQPHQGIREFSKELADMPGFLKEEAGIGGKTQAEIETFVAREFRILWIKSLVFIVIGIFSGILIVQKRNLGRFLALGLSLYLVGIRFYHFFGLEHWRDRLSIKYFTIRFKYFPIRAIHEDITYLILLGVIALLLMPSIARKFKTDRFKKVTT